MNDDQAAAGSGVDIASFDDPFVEPHAGEIANIVLVLEGGGAKGVVHVGALQELERATRPLRWSRHDAWPRYKLMGVSGTSFGALIAALRAAGYTSRAIIPRLPDRPASDDRSALATAIDEGAMRQGARGANHFPAERSGETTRELGHAPFRAHLMRAGGSPRSGRSEWSPKTARCRRAGTRRVADGILGMSSNETSNLLGISEQTVRSHLKKAQVKLGARNCSHAAAEAIRRQLIP
jgi:DNA-binding CsgD family transcriptional regulator